jgi:HEAT repeat protein
MATMMSEPQGPKTANELLTELEQNPEFVERQHERMAQRETNRRHYNEAAVGLIGDLAAAGFPVETLAQLRQRGVGNRQAVPSLLKWLPLVSYRPLKLDIIATLGSNWAHPAAAGPLISEFLRVKPTDDVTGTSVRWAIGDALERVADESVLNDLIEIATDTRHGRYRGTVVAALGNMRRARDQVLPTLLTLLDDDDIAGYAIMALGKLKASEARSAIEPFIHHRDPWVRKEAKKALDKI